MASVVSKTTTQGITPPAQLPDLSNLSYSAMTGPTVFDHATANPTAHPAAVAAANFIDQLHASDMGALDPNIQIALAGMGTKNPLVPHVISAVKTAASAVKDQVGHVFSDPSLKTEPTTMDKLKWHFANTGIPAVAQQDIKKTQQLLIDQGYAPRMLDGTVPVADGTWDNNWNQILYNKHQAEFAKPGIGNMSAKEIAKDLVFGLPSHAIPLIVDIVNSLPATLRTILEMPQGKPLYDLGAAPPKNIDIKNLLITDVGTALTASSLVNGAAKGVEAVATGVGQATKAGGGNIAKGMVTSMGEAANAPKFTFLNTLFPKTGELTQYGNAERRLLFSRVLQNMPVIGRINGLMTKVTDPLATGAGHLWETTRNALAQPYRLPGVAIAGDVGTQVMTTGMKLGAIGKVESGLGDTQGPQAQVLTHLKPIAGILGTGLDALSMGAHAPLYHFGGNASVQFGHSVEGWRQGIAEGLNQTDKITEWEHGTHSVFADEVSKLAQRLAAEGDLQASAHADTLIRQSILNDISIFSASHGAQAYMEDAMKRGQTFNDGSYQQTFQALESRILNSPSELEKWRESMMSTNGLARSYWAKATANMKQNSDYLTQNDFTTKLMSDHNIQTQAMPHAQELVTPQTLAKNSEVVSAPDLTASDPWTVHQPRPTAPAAVRADDLKPITVTQRNRLMALMKERGMTNRGKSLDYVSQIVGRSVASRNDLTQLEAGQVIQELAKTVHPNSFPDVFMAPDLNEGSNLASFGRAKLDTQTVPMAQKKAYQLGQEYQKIEPSFDPESIITKPHLEPGITAPPIKPVKDFLAINATDAEMEIRAKALDYLGSELGLNIKELAFYDTPSLLAQINKESHRLPGDVVVPLGAHPDLIASEAYQKSLGYKFVWGTDIGHSFMQSPFDLTRLGTGQSKLARAITNMGLDFTKVNPSVANTTLTSEASSALQDALRNTARYTPGELPSWATSANLLQYARSVISPEMNAVLGGQHWAAVKLGKFNKELAAVKAANPGLSDSVYRAMVKDAITKTSGPGDWSLGEFVKAMGIPADQEITLLSGMKIHGAGIEKETAKKIYDDIQKGLRKVPASVVGAKNPLTVAIQSGFGFGGRRVLGMDGTRLPNLTRDARQVAIKFRYQGFFAFAMKRVIKTGLKGMTEGVPFTSNPTRTMAELGTTARYQKLWQDFAPQAVKDLRAPTDDVEKMFSSNDVYNIYKPRDEEAYILGTLYDNAKAMSADGTVNMPDLLKTFDKVVSYGSRTAAEKSMNAIFFPFSFEKTVMRQLGGSLLDSSAQRMMVVSALNAYDSLGGQKVKAWLEANAPLFKEAEKFNPFGHGIGLGQFGGIDRLYWDIGRQTFIQALAPKGIANAQGAAAVLALVPAFRDLNNMLIGIDTTGKKPNQLGGEVLNTLHTSAWELGNKINEMGNWLTGGRTKKAFAPSGQSDPYLPQGHLTYDQQQTDAWNGRSAFLTAYASYLDANERGANYVWPIGTPEGLVGEKITKTSIGTLINHVYPAWDPAKSMEYVAVSKAAAAHEQGVIATKSPQLLTYYKAFIKNADTVNGYLAKDSYTAAQWAQAVDAMRQSAIYLSYYDRTFYNFYKQYYQSKYGPLEAMR